jgi:hypothetical protein
MREVGWGVGSVLLGDRTVAMMTELEIGKRLFEAEFDECTKYISQEEYLTFGLCWCFSTGFQKRVFGLVSGRLGASFICSVFV